MNFLLKLLFLVIISHVHLYSKVLIITHVYNRPEFLDWQCRCFQKFLQDDYEFVVFNDARPGPMHEAIKAMCDRWLVRCIPIPQELHDHPQEEPFWEIDTGEGTRRHVDGIQYSLDLLGYDYDGAVAIFDSDMFLIKPCSFEQLLQNYDIAAINRGASHSKGDIVHLWPGLTILAMNRLPNKKTLDFKCGRIKDCLVDTGGYTYYYLQNNKDVRCLSLGYFPLGNWHVEASDFPLKERLRIYKRLNFEEREISWLLKYSAVASMEFYYFNHFIHYGAGRFAQDVKSMALAEYMEALL